MKKLPNPWPIGSLCTNIKQFDIVPPNHVFKETLLTLARNTSLVKELPLIFLGLNLISSNLSQNYIVTLLFATEFGVAGWSIWHDNDFFYYDGRRQTHDLFKQIVSNYFRCTSRFDKALG